MKEGFPIAGGTEKLIYKDPKNANRVLKRYREEETSETHLVRARFYLAKILHGLMPNNFPDIHQSTSKPNQVIMDRVTLDADHAELQRVLKTTSQHQVNLGPVGREKFRAYRDARKADPRVIGLIQTLKDTGIDFDQASLNFSLDSDAAVYLDTIEPWEEAIDRESDNAPILKRNFDTEKLHQRIQGLANDSERERLGIYLDRLTELYSAEKTEFEKHEK